jgi:hypothetical protein
MRRLTLALLVLLAACTSAPPFTEPAKRAAALGKSKAEILAEFGQPTETANAGGQDEALLYVYHDVVLYGPSGPATAIDYRCEVTFQLTDDRVSAIDTEGPDCGQ